ncbi:2OG-Fe(II) oxygenase [Nocardia yamanashiensis]|uniref:2OG-Fe(II) oxygenase n=1 Tax=Nocardia yamanashiensis TaxID=209247 RepID=UPI00082EBD35|nr:2OG-Fe(II) oxygenase [Nocardia yamanashiensis]
MIDTAVVLHPGTVTCVDGFLDGEECARINDDLLHTFWWESPIIRLDRQQRLISGHSITRTSSTTDETWLSEQTRELLRAIEHRLAADFATPPNHFEPWQLARYRAGERFDEHHDSGFFINDPWGERTISILIYLTDSPSGGSTYFPTLRRRFHPTPGRLLAWPNLLPDGAADPRMRHIACPARRVKTILSTWIRQLPTDRRTLP